jgi:hypothetical protein
LNAKGETIAGHDNSFMQNLTLWLNTQPFFTLHLVYYFVDVIRYYSFSHYNSCIFLLKRKRDFALF